MVLQIHIQETKTNKHWAVLRSAGVSFPSTDVLSLQLYFPLCPSTRKGVYSSSCWFSPLCQFYWEWHCCWAHSVHIHVRMVHRLEWISADWMHRYCSHMYNSHDLFRNGKLLETHSRYTPLRRPKESNWSLSARCKARANTRHSCWQVANITCKGHALACNAILVVCRTQQITVKLVFWLGLALSRSCPSLGPRMAPVPWH